MIKPAPPSPIPNRADTLRVLRLISNAEPLLMLTGSDDGYGSRWTLSGQQVQPAIARYLMDAGYVAESGKTGFGARVLALTDDGLRFRENGNRWWAALGLFEKIRIMIFG